MQQVSVSAASNDVGSKGRLWLAFVLPAVLVGMMTLSVWSDLRRFNEKAPLIEAHGTVEKLDCDNHGQYEVRFTTGAQTLTRESGNLYLRARCHNLKLGQTVRVWYSAQDPGYVSFIRPDEALSYMKGEIVQIIFIGYPLMAGFLFVALRFSRDKLRVA
jgi:hypothetical protein